MRGMTRTLSLRRTSITDLSAVDALLARSDPRLLAADYPPSILTSLYPDDGGTADFAGATRAACMGTCFLAEHLEGRVLARRRLDTWRAPAPAHGCH